MDDGTVPPKELMALSEFLGKTGLSPSTERRLRNAEEDWPPYVVLGKQIFYLRTGWSDWLARRSGANPAGAGLTSGPGRVVGDHRKVGQ